MEQKVTLELNIQQLNIIIAGLAKLPLESAIDTFTFVQNQAKEQLNTQPSGQLADKIID